jgi:Predicted outer membrane protein
VSLTGGTDPGLSTTGILYDRIGTKLHSFEIRDDESLSPLFPLDNSMTTTSRRVTVRTLAKPDLVMTYPSGTFDREGVSIAGNIYSGLSPLNDCGGEQGWTNKALDITVSPGGILGDFQTLLRLNSSNTIMNPGGSAVRSNYHTATSSSDALLGGTLARGVLTERGSGSAAINNELSAPIEGRIKIDRTNPVANITHHGGLNFTCNSTDTLSGISILHPTKVAFIIGSATPADSDYHELDAIPAIAPGNYNLWVWATDKAGNEHKVRRNSNLRISGNVTISKNTDVGATLHAVSCINSNQIVVSGSCTPDCQVGANAEQMASSELVYILRLKNSDTSTSATGSFTDVLPAGFVPVGMPVRVNISGTGDIFGVTSVLGGSSYTVAGNFTLAENAEMEIHIRGNLPVFDTTVGAINLVQNQANIAWQIGSGASAVNGTDISNYANHRVNTAPSIYKESNWGAAVHVDACENAGSLTIAASCATSCVAGNPGTVQEGDVITYQLVFSNPSYTTQYFATDAGVYDAMPVGVTLANQSWSIDIEDELDIVTPVATLTIPISGNSSYTSGTWPDANGNYVRGLAIHNNRLIQDTANTLSVAPRSKVIVTITASVVGNAGDMLNNQVTSGFVNNGSGSNTGITQIGNPSVEMIRSNHVSHQIESGTTLNKWAYSTTSSANDPTTHHALCLDAGNPLALGSCTDCNTGNARLQGGNILTYALTMDNTQNTHVARALDGNVTNTAGLSIPGIRMNTNHLDNTLPQGLTPDVATLRAYVTDSDGNNITINDGGTTSTAQIVNENGSNISRQVLDLSIGNTNIYNAGNSALLFALQNLNLSLSGSQWIWEVNNTHHHARGSIYNQGSYSITYLFDAEVTTAYDESVPANNIWVNQWEQQIPFRVHNPEIATNTTVPINTLLHSNTTVHMRISEGVDTLFTKVGADDLTGGLSGAEFALYKWDGSNPPTTAQANHIVDSSVLVDTATLPAGQWVRVKENGEDALITDIFISGSSPLGEIDLGKLQTGTYTLVETKAPSGYTLPVGQWILTIDSEKGDTGTGDWKIDFVGKSASIAPPAAIRDESVPSAPTYKMINAEPFLIGLSGLGGTTGMLLTGFVLMAIAGNVYLVQSYKRRKKQKQ